MRVTTCLLYRILLVELSSRSSLLYWVSQKLFFSFVIVSLSVYCLVAGSWQITHLFFSFFCFSFMSTYECVIKSSNIFSLGHPLTPPPFYSSFLYPSLANHHLLKHVVSNN